MMPLAGIAIGRGRGETGLESGGLTLSARTAGVKLPLFVGNIVVGPEPGNCRRGIVIGEGRDVADAETGPDNRELVSR